ncbi:MAG: SDR family NAD(P)-dependent oxidoreductase [Chitinivibrionales bacterium]|nr:SDR family NAD(P)-dependent oxidoreductase [Chitinivibrionales bacterium]
MSSTILITGASRGLGLELTRHFLGQQCHVYAGARDASSRALQDLRQQYPSTLTIVALDVTDQQSIDTAANAVGDACDGLDICINNAAISTSERFGTLETLNFAEAQALYDTNALGPLRVARAFLPLLQRGSSPVIVNVSSEAGQIAQNPRDGEFEYCMSKAALNMATHLLSRRLKGVGIRVLALHPGWIRTDMGGQDACGDPGEAAAALASVICVHRTDLDGHVFFDWQGGRMNW